MAQRKLTKIAAALVLGALVASPRGVLADERTEARGHFKKGMADIADGRYDTGIDELKRAYDILPHPNVLYNIARAYVDMGDLENAVVYYRRYLEGNPRDRDEVLQIISSLEARIRKQQAQLFEAQQAQTAGAAGPAQPGALPGGAPGPGAGQAPGAGPGGATPSVAPGGAVGGGVKVEGGQLKTEEVFEETVVTASKAAQSPLDAPNSTSIITEQDIRLSGILEIPELLRRLAGADIMELTGTQTEVSLRGFNQRLSNKVLVLVDGRSVYTDLIGATFWSSLNVSVDDIERIEVVRGPGSALYGADAFNGVINIISKAPGRGGSGFKVGYGDHDTTHGEIWASGRDREVAYRLAASYDYVPRWSREVPPGRADLHLLSGDQDSSARGSKVDANITRTFGRDVLVGLQASYVSGSSEILGSGPVADHIIAAAATDLMAYLHWKHLELRAFWNNEDGGDANNAAYVGQSLLPARFKQNVVDGEVQYIDKFEVGHSVDNDLHIGAAYRLKTIEWTNIQNATENHFGFFLHDEVRFAQRFALIGDYRADYVPYLRRVVQSPRGSVLFHPSKKSTIRGVVGTAFRTPTFLESYFNAPIQLPISGGALANPNAGGANRRLQPEQIFTTELGYMNSESDYFTFDSAIFYNHASNLIDISPNLPITVADVANPAAPTALDPASGLYPLFFGGFENECQKYNVYGAELGVRTFPVEGLDLYGNYTLMDVKQDNTACSTEQLNLLANDARTSMHKVNAGVQVRTKVGVDGEVDFHYVSPEDWAEQISNVQRQRIEYQSFHLDSYTLLNARIGYRFPGNQAELSGASFNLLDDRHREHPFGQIIDRRFMAIFSYKF